MFQSGYQDMEESQYARQVAKATGIGLLTYSFHVEAFRCNLPRAMGSAPLRMVL
jgi:asparagine synthetase B (glutamine-hydrolysing)